MCVGRGSGEEDGEGGGSCLNNAVLFEILVTKKLGQHSFQLFFFFDLIVVFNSQVFKYF